MRCARRSGRCARSIAAGEIDDLLKPENKTAALPRAGEGVQQAHRRAARHPGQERVRPDLQRGGRLGHERLHVRGHDGLLHHRAGQQAGAVDVDGVGPDPAPGLPRVLCRARRGVRGAADADGIDAAGQVPGGVQRDVLGILALRLAGRRLAVGHPGHLQGAGGRVLRDLLFAAEHHAHSRGRLRAGQGRGAGEEILRAHPARPEDAAGRGDARSQAAGREAHVRRGGNEPAGGHPLAHGAVPASRLLCAGNPGPDSVHADGPALQGPGAGQAKWPRKRSPTSPR